MKKRSILTAIALILILMMTACSGKTKEAETADSKETAQESAAEEGSAAEEAVEAEPAEEPAEAVPVEEPAEAEPAEEPAEAVPAEPAAASVTMSISSPPDEVVHKASPMGKLAFAKQMTDEVPTRRLLACIVVSAQSDLC